MNSRRATMDGIPQVKEVEEELNLKVTGITN